MNDVGVVIEKEVLGIGVERIKRVGREWGDERRGGKRRKGRGEEGKRED